MIRFGAEAKDGTHLIGLGLSDENVSRLTAGQPVFVAGSTVGKPDVTILIFHGRTEYELTEAMATLIGPTTVIRPLRPSDLPPDHPDYRERA